MRLLLGTLIVAASTLVALPARAVALHPDLAALISAQGDDPRRFAVAYPYAVDALNVGTWSEEGGAHVWRYEITVPTALGLGLHAVAAAFPEGTRATIVGADRQRQPLITEAGEVWSPVIPGDTVALEIQVPQAALEQFRFRLDQIQIVYRGQGGAADHPIYSKLYAKAGNCTLNYSCERNAANATAGRAAVAVQIQNQILCSGTLLANTAGTLRPLLLTARHCQVSGDTGTGIRVFYKAEAACGAALGIAHEDGIAVSGVTHLASRGDAWLLEVAPPPAAAGAWWAGWDASDADPAMQAYLIHHQDALDKQFAGSAAAPFKQDYTLDGGSVVIPGWTWTTGLGDAGPGASGAGTFVGNRLIGVFSGGKGSCGQTETNSSMRLADLFNAPAFRDALDPGNTGVRQVAGRDASSVVVNLHASVGNILLGTVLTLSWTTQNAQSCVASGAWSGTKPTAGSQNVGINLLGFLTYRLHCTNAQGQSGDGVATVNAYDSSSPPPSTPPSSGADQSSGSGGGCWNVFALLGLLAGVLGRRRIRF